MRGLFAQVVVSALLLNTSALVTSDPGYEAVKVADNTEVTASSRAAASARAAAKEANDIAAKSVGATEHAQSTLKAARNAIRDARASSGGMSVNQKELLKDAEAQLREAALSAEYGKLKQAKLMKAKGHYVKSSSTRLKRLEDKLSSKTVDFKSSDHELEALRAELAHLRSDLDGKTLEEQVNYVDAVGGKSDEDLRRELAELDQRIVELEEAEASGKTGLSHDEMKAETMRLQENIARLEVERLAEPRDDDIAALKYKLAEVQRERELRQQKKELQAKIDIAMRQAKLQEQQQLAQEMEIIHRRQAIIEHELGQEEELSEEAMEVEIRRLRTKVQKLEKSNR